MIGSGSGAADEAGGVVLVRTGAQAEAVGLGGRLFGAPSCGPGPLPDGAVPERSSALGEDCPVVGPYGDLWRSDWVATPDVTMAHALTTTAIRATFKSIWDPLASRTVPPAQGGPASAATAFAGG